MAAVVVLATAIAVGCGDDPADPEPFSAAEWRERADQFCDEGAQDATALPPPGSRREIAEDASARAEIIATVRDGIVTLGTPDGIDDRQLTSYLVALEADVGKLEQLAEGGGSGGAAVIDETTGGIAGDLGLQSCAAFVNAVARTP